MPETACLHVQTQGEDAVRVVDLPGHSMRIGRAVYCGLRLTGPDVADEACRVRRQGDGWALIPASPKQRVSVDGVSLAGPRALGYGETFEVGPYRITLHSSGAPVLSSEHRPARRLADITPVAMTPISGDGPAPPEPWTPKRPETSDRWRSTQRETRRWESKWRSAAAKLTTAPAPGYGPSAGSAVAAYAARTVERPAPPRPASRPLAARRRDGLETLAPLSPAPLPMYAPPKRISVRTSRTVTRAPSPVLERPAAVTLTAPPETVMRSAPPVEPVAAPVVVPEGPAPGVVEEVQAASPVVVDSEPSVEATEADVLAARESEIRAAGIAFEARLERFFAENREPAVADAPAIEVVEQVVGVEPSAQVEATPSSPTVDIDEDEEDRAAEAAAPVRQLGSVSRVAPAPLSEAEFEPFVERYEGPAAAGGEALVERMAGWFERAFEPAGGDWPRAQAAEEAVIDATFVQTPEPEPEPVAAVEVPPEQVWGANRPFVTDTSRLGAAANDWETGGVKATAGWPTVNDILAAQGVRRDPRPDARSSNPPPRPAASRTARAVGTEVPTDPAEPASWSVPLWLGWLPAAAASVGLVVVGAGAAWTWTVDAYNAGVVAARLTPDGPGAALGPNARPLPEGVAVGRTSWWATTAHNLANWAAYIDRTAADAAQTDEARGLIDRAVEASPLEATARFALAHPIPGEPDPGLARGLGQTRDVVSLAWSGRQLLTAGKVEAARAAYRAALEMAARSDLSRAATPAFLDDARNRRYALPSEELLATVVRDMAGQTAWTYKDWADVVPRGTAAPLAVARVLREAGSVDADAALGVALAEADSGAADGVGAEAAVRLAATAEALALKGRWADADDRYRRAIDLMPADVVQRSWWINVADIAVRLNEEPKRLKALESAKSTDLKDEVTVRAVDLQKASGLGARPVVRTARAPGLRD